VTMHAGTDGMIVLCERLAHATRTRDAEWRVDSNDRFVWERPQASISIGSRDKDGEPPYQLVLFNANGDKVEELTSQLVGDDEPAAWNEPLAGLYRAARRSALGADQLIDALIAALPSASEERVGQLT